MIPLAGISQLTPVFIPNAGQWHENVVHRMEVRNGDIYMEHDGIKFAFYDEEFFHHVHADANPDSVLKIHAFKVNFVGCDTNAVITSHDKGTALYSYYLGKDVTKWASGLTASRKLIYHELYPLINLNIYTTNEGLKYEFQVLPGGNVSDIKLDIEGADKVELIRRDLQISTSTKILIDKAPYSYVGDQDNEVASSYILNDSVVSFLVGENYSKTDTLIIDPDLVFSTYSGSTTNNFGFTATYDELGFLYSGSSVFGIGYPTTLGAYSVVFSSNPTGGNDVVYDPFFGWVNAGYTNTDIGISKYDTSGTKLIYSTYLGGELCEVPHSIIVNSKDELMILGTTGSATFPITSGAYDNSFGGGSKINLSRGIAVNYVNGSDIFVAKLSNDGTQLLASSYFGGSQNDGVNELLNYNYADQMRGDIAVDSDDKVYISTCTYSNDLANINGAQSNSNGGSDGLVAKFDSDLTTLEWGTYLGGSGHDACYSLILDNSNNVIVSGGTASADLTTTPGVVYPTFQGVPTDGFIAKISSDGSNFDALTYYGTHAYDQVYFVRIDDEQNIYIYGQSASMDGTLVHNAGYFSTNSGMFISKLSNDLTNVVWSTTFGSGDGRINLSPTAFAVDICNNIYLSGWGSPSFGFSLIPNWIIDPSGLTGHNGGTGTLGMDVTADAFQGTTNGNDFYLLVLDDDANTLQYASFYGGNLSNEHVDGGTSRFDRKGNIYQSVCAGCGGNDDFPIKPNPGAVSSTNNASCNNGVFKFDFQIPAIVADFIAPEQGCLNTTYQFNNTSNILDSTTYFWSFGDDSTSTLSDPSHQYLKSGTFTVKLIIRDPVSCNLVDSISKIITLRDDSLILSKVDTSCAGDSLQIGLLLSFSDSTTFNWSPRQLFSDSTVLLPKALTDSSVSLLLIVTSQPGCSDTVLHSVYVPNYTLQLSDSVVCAGDTILNFVNSNLAFSTYQWSSISTYSDTLNPSVSDTSFKYFVQPNDTTFYLRIVDESTCVFIDSLKLDGGDFSIVINSDTMVCDTSSIWGQVVPINGTIDTISWGPGSGVLQGADSTSALLSVVGPVNSYGVAVKDVRGCVDSATTVISHRLNGTLLTKLDTSCAGDSLQIELSNVFIDSTNYNWSPGSVFSDSSTYEPKVFTDSSLTLTLLVNDYLGCIDTIIYPVFVPEYQLQFSDTIACFSDTTTNFVMSNPSFVAYHWSSTSSFSDQLNVLLTDTSFTYIVAEGDTTFYIQVTDSSNCMFVDSLTINGVNFQMKVNLDTLVCDTVAIWGNIVSHQMNGLDSISWSPSNRVYQGQDSTSALLSIYSYLSDFQIYARDTNGCVSRDSIRIVDNSLSFDLNDTTICFGDTIQLGYELSHNPLYTYEWIPNVVFDKDSLFTKALLTDSVNVVLVIDNSFCIDTVNQLISVNKIDVSSSVDTILCNNLDPLTVGVLGVDTLLYHWSNDAAFSDTVQRGVGIRDYTFIPNIGVATYFISGQDDFGCVDTAQVRVTSSVFDLTYPTDSTLCLNDTIRLFPNEDLTGLGDLLFSWNPSGIILSDTSLSTVNVYAPNGKWVVTVKSQNQYGCKDSDVVTLYFAGLDTTVISAVVNPKTILDTESALITVSPQDNLYDISPDEPETAQEGNVFTVFPKESKTYVLTVIDSLYGKCRNITSVDIEVLKFVCDDPYIYVPNAFTPNGDGENDLLFVRGKNITKLYFAIFNRWGQKVFETEQQHIGWDGLYKGMEIDPAVYDYYLKYECEGEKEHFKKGNITLIR